MDNEKKQIFGIGVSGLVGSRIVELLPHYSFIPLSISEGVDITDITTLGRISTNAPILLLAAKADVDGCEKDWDEDRKILEYKDYKQQEEEFKTKKTAWGLNVFGVQNILEVAKRNGNKIIYISTDFIFGGDDTPEKGYTEMSVPSPINWYGETKLKAEQLVTESGLPYAIVRIAYPYRKEFSEKQDFVRAIYKKLSQNEQVLAVTDHIMTPTHIDDIAKALDVLLSTNQTGIFHVVGSQFITPYEAALLIAKRFSLNGSLIHQTTRNEFFARRAKRPFNLSMNNDKIGELQISMKSFEEGLKTI